LKERLILAHSFRGFIPWAILRQSTMAEEVEEESFSLMAARKQRERERGQG
jgi:hypothetical protein